MPPRKRPKSGSKGSQSSSCILDLPLPALAQIYQSCDDASRKALVRVSAFCRGWVLREARSLVLKLPINCSTAARKPLARLLNRACTLGSTCSINLCLDFSSVEDQESRLLTDLLEAGIQQSGWASVSKLVLQGLLVTSTPAKLVCTAFPALQRLELVEMPLNWEDLQALTSCSQLSCLRVVWCALPATAPANNPLSALVSLKELLVIETTSFLAQGLTQLTSLRLYCTRGETLSHLIVRCLDGMQELQQLDLTGTARELPAPLAAQLYSKTPHLKGLTLGNTINQQAFDALLTHSTQLTRLTCWNLQLSEDRSQSACNWKELVVQCYCDTLQTLAYLPLHSFTRVSLHNGYTFEIPSAEPLLNFELRFWDPNPYFTQPAQIQATLTNLGLCPAWQATPSVRILLISLGQQPTVEQYLQCLSALAASGGRKVRLVMRTGTPQITGEIVECLGTTLGHSLTRLSLPECSITHDFWPAVWRHLPGLQALILPDGAKGAISSTDIAAFCSHATRPLSLRLGKVHYSSVGPAEQLEQQCRTWGVPQVTVAQL